MNYVSHTRAAHERLLAQPAARPQHISLYWVLFFQWNAARFPKSLPLDRRAVMAAARIGNRGTYLNTLRDLDAWGLLAYEPSHTDTSTVQLLAVGEVVPEVGQPEPVGCTNSGPTKTGEVVPEVGQPLYQKWDNLVGGVVPEVVQHSLLVKTPCSVNSVNGAAAPQKKMGGRVFEGEGLSEVQVLEGPASPNGAGPAQAPAPQKKVAPKKKGVGSEAETIRAAATAVPDEPRRRGALPELPFSQSAIASPEAFAAAFAGTDYELADLRHYHQLVATWRDKKTGHPPQRKDWVATAKRFMLNDAADNRLKLAPGHSPVAAAGADASAQNSGIPTTGYRSTRWD